MVPTLMLRFAVVVLALSLAGCGFQLRGASQIAPQWQPLMLQWSGDEVDAQAYLQKTLAQQIALTQEPEEAASILELQVEPLQTQSIASGADGVEIISLSREIQMNWRDAQGENLLQDRIRRQRDLEIDANLAIASEQEISRADQELLNDLLRVLNYRLQSLQP